MFLWVFFLRFLVIQISFYLLLDAEQNLAQLINVFLVMYSKGIKIYVRGYESKRIFKKYI